MVALLATAATLPVAAASADDSNTAAAPVEPDLKLPAATSFATSAAPPDVDDDPKAAWAWSAVARTVHHVAPAAKLSYRSFTIPNLDGSDLRLHAGEVDIYALSYRYFRLGIDMELGGGKGTVKEAGKDVATSAWYLAAGLSLGFQYPMRVTPFVDARFIAGFLGGDAAGKPALTYTYMAGIDGGIEVYFWSHYYFSGAIGWIHPVYRGVDYAYMMANPMGDPKFVTVQNDTLTFKIGIGM